jgi:hypothetical protein
MMTFTEALIAAGYVFDDENYDGCYVKQDDDGFIHLYQENVDDETDTLWNYVKMSDDFDVISEVTFNPNTSTVIQ